jgi:ComEC/Rec2-related protein
MIIRIGVLITLLGLRLFIGGLSSQACQSGQQVRISGKVVNTTQTDSNRIIQMGSFLVLLPAQTRAYQGDFLTVIGSCQRRVIDFWLSQTRLHSAQIELREPQNLLTGTNDWAQWRSRLAGVYKRQLTEPEAGLTAGIVLGVKSNLEPEFYQRLIDTGMVHIVVASGYNLGLVAIFLSSIMWWFLPRLPATMAILLALTGYAQLTGGEPPVMRALIMIGLVLLLPLLGRRLPGWYTFSLALWLMLMFDPSLIASISFQLSAAATAGLVWVGPILGNWMGSGGRGRLLGAFGTDLASTLAAQIATAPLIFWHFGRVSWLSPLANALIAPLIGPLTVFGFLQQLEALILPYGGMVALSTLMLSRAVSSIINLVAGLT